MSRVVAHKRVLVVIAAGWLAACHSVSHVDETTLGPTKLRLRQGPNRLGNLTIGVSADGTLRAQKPTWCPHDILAPRTHYVIKRKRPNMATFILGVIAVSAGGISAVVGGADDKPASSPFTWLGAAAIGVGIPLAVGPFTGNTSTRRKVGEDTARQGSKWVRCGNTPTSATRAVLDWGKTRVPSPVGPDGRLAVSAFDLVDAFDLSRTPALALDATVTTSNGDTNAKVFVGTNKLTRARAGFFRRINVSSEVKPMRKVPNLETKTLLVTRTEVQGHPAVLLELMVENAGPGDAWGVRGAVSATLADVDARMIYIGHIPARGIGRGRVVIPVSSASANLLDARIAVSLHDAHKTTSSSAYRFRGPVLNATPER